MDKFLFTLAAFASAEKYRRDVFSSFAVAKETTMFVEFIMVLFLVSPFSGKSSFTENVSTDLINLKKRKSLQFKQNVTIKLYA